MRAWYAPLCVLSLVRPPDDRDGKTADRRLGKKEDAINALTSPFIGGSDLYATRFSDRFRAFSLYSLHSDFFRRGEGGGGGSAVDATHAAGNARRFLFPPSRRSPGAWKNHGIARARHVIVLPYFVARLTFHSFTGHTRKESLATRLVSLPSLLYSEKRKRNLPRTYSLALVMVCSLGNQQVTRASCRSSCVVTVSIIRLHLVRRYFRCLKVNE